MRSITIAKGDGIGPEIMEAALKIMEAANVELQFDEVNIGKKAFLAGHSSGIPPEAWDTIRKNKIFLKAPITTPQGGGYKSLNVTMRKTLNLFANVRPCKSYSPYVTTKHPELDIIVVRENEEDLYAAIEHQQTPEVVQCLKLITRPGCERIVRYAFEYAQLHKRKKVTCLTKDNIMKQTDGLFHSVFNEIAAEYPAIESEHLIVDIGTARLADTPEWYDVVVVPNLYGDIISDVVAQITGSVGLAGSANIGMECAMFEAIHGSAPDIAGKNVANPSGLIQATVMMLNHLGLNEKAALIQNAWLRTIEEGVHTADIYNEETSTQKVSTKGFTEAVIANLGKQPQHLDVTQKIEAKPIQMPAYKRKPLGDKQLLGVDVFVDWAGEDANEIAQKLLTINNDSINLTMITNRGVKVWPNGFDETFCTDHWRCRYESASGQPLNKMEVVNLLKRAEEAAIDTIKTENLYAFDGKQAFSLGQGQ